MWLVHFLHRGLGQLQHGGNLGDLGGEDGVDHRESPPAVEDVHPLGGDAALNPNREGVEHGRGELLVGEGEAQVALGERSNRAAEDASKGVGVRRDEHALVVVDGESRGGGEGVAHLPFLCPDQNEGVVSILDHWAGEVIDEGLFTTRVNEHPV